MSVGRSVLKNLVAICDDHVQCRINAIPGQLIVDIRDETMEPFLCKLGWKGIPDHRVLFCIGDVCHF